MYPVFQNTKPSIPGNPLSKDSLPRRLAISLPRAKFCSALPFPRRGRIVSRVLQHDAISVPSLVRAAAFRRPFTSVPHPCGSLRPLPRPCASGRAFPVGASPSDGRCPVCAPPDGPSPSARLPQLTLPVRAVATAKYHVLALVLVGVPSLGHPFPARAAGSRPFSGPCMSLICMCFLRMSHPSDGAPPAVRWEDPNSASMYSFPMFPVAGGWEQSESSSLAWLENAGVPGQRRRIIPPNVAATASASFPNMSSGELDRPICNF